jgi:hypothetical protein
MMANTKILIRKEYYDVKEFFNVNFKIKECNVLLFVKIKDILNIFIIFFIYCCFSCQNIVVCKI